MLKDIVTITIETFNEAFCADKILSRPKRVYDVYRNLQELISNVSLVANHYLALDFTEHFLENSSFGEPIDKCYPSYQQGRFVDRNKGGCWRFITKPPENRN